jgi:hypothetical protein
LEMFWNRGMSFSGKKQHQEEEKREENIFFQSKS